ncbi:MAG: hypothetical protein ABI540_00790 [Spartobacteria bacterium]
MDKSAASELANISTRGFVETGSNVMIGGFILGSDANVLVRAIGPTLSDFGVAGALQDPTLELRDAQGTLVSSNDNWKETQQAELKTQVWPRRRISSQPSLTRSRRALTPRSSPGKLAARGWVWSKSTVCPDYIDDRR